jgi:hypothetical protein
MRRTGRGSSRASRRRPGTILPPLLFRCARSSEHKACVCARPSMPQAGFLEGITGFRRESVLPEAPEERATPGDCTMTRLALFGTAAVLSIAFASPLPAQAVTVDSAACSNLSQASQNGAAPAPTASWIPPGRETATRPWSAPVGHRQPQMVDVPATASFEQALDAENAKVDRLIKGICRGC